MQTLIAILEIDPFQNPPSFEKLVGDLSGAYSRRINIQRRHDDRAGTETTLCYRIAEFDEEIRLREDYVLAPIQGFGFDHMNDIRLLAHHPMSAHRFNHVVTVRLPTIHPLSRAPDTDVSAKFSGSIGLA